MAYIQALICSLIFAVISLIWPKSSSLPAPILFAVARCQNLGYSPPSAFIPLPTPKSKPIGHCETSPDGIAANAGIAEVTQKPIVLAPKNEPIIEYNFSTLVSAYTHGIELRRYINYVQKKSGGLKEVHRLFTSPIGTFPPNYGNLPEEKYLAGKTKPVTVLRNDNIILWSGEAESVKVVNTPNAGFTHLLVSSASDALHFPEKIVYIVPTYPSLTTSYRVVTSREFFDVYKQSLSQAPITTGFTGSNKQHACGWFHAKNISFRDPWNTVTPTHHLVYVLGSGWFGDTENLAVPINACISWLDQIAGWPVSYNAAATSFNPDGIDPVESISLTSHPYACRCGGKTEITCATYTLTVGKKTYLLGNDFQFYKPLSSFMSLLNGSFVLLYQGSLYEVSSQ